MKLFFQSSMPRSGSTLFQNLMAQNPDFYVTPTSGALELLFAARNNYTSSAEFRAQNALKMKMAFLSFCHDGLFGYYAALTSKRYVLDKSRGWGVHFDFLEAILGEKPKIICLVRDLRQILCSMELLYRAAPDRHKNGENPQTLQNITTLRRVLANLQSPPVGLALERLREIFTRGWDEHFLFIRYEDLIAQPLASLHKTYAYLGKIESPRDTVFRDTKLTDYAVTFHRIDKIQQVTQEDDAVFGFASLHTIREKMDSAPVVHDAAEILGMDALQIIDQAGAWYQKRFKYA